MSIDEEKMESSDLLLSWMKIRESILFILKEALPRKALLKKLFYVLSFYKGIYVNKESFKKNLNILSSTNRIILTKYRNANGGEDYITIVDLKEVQNGTQSIYRR